MAHASSKSIALAALVVTVALALLLKKQRLCAVACEQQLIIAEFPREGKTLVDADARQRILAAECGGRCSGVQHLASHKRVVVSSRQA